MNNKPTFEHTVDILVKAYMNDELEHSTCSACAVGNIVAAAMGTKPRKNVNGPIVFDNNYFENGEPAMLGWYNYLYGPGSFPGETQAELTGYSKFELRRIEQAFETAPGRPDGDELFKGKTTDPEWMFNGLMAVVDVLAEIHGISTQTKEESKKLFIKI